MPNWEHSELFLFLLFFVPGFISLKIYDLLIPGDRRDVRSVLTEAIGDSSINFAILSPIIFLFVFGHGAFHYLGVQMAAIFFFLFVAPAIWPFLLVRIFRSRQAARYLVNPIPKPWDVVFRGLAKAGSSYIWQTDVASVDGTPRDHRLPRIRRTNSCTSKRCGGWTKKEGS